MLTPDESLFRQHLEEPTFLLGAALAKWGLHEPIEKCVWPHAVIWVTSHRSLMAQGRVYLRFTLDGYPQQAPTGCPWDAGGNSALAPSHWPRGEVNVSRVFKPSWNATALYAPCDRVAMNGHGPWQQQFPRWWWQSDFTIVRYLEFVHECLNPIDEVG